RHTRFSRDWSSDMCSSDLFAMYQGRANPDYGTISPSGWYAYYPSGQSGSEAAPAWLALYEGSLRMLPGSIGYAAIQYNDPNSCEIGRASCRERVYVWVVAV